MKFKPMIFSGLLVFIVGIQASAQRMDIDVGGMRENVRAAAKENRTWYGVVDIKKTNDTFEIIYDINAADSVDYEVDLALVRDGDPEFRIVPGHTAGKIGTGQFAGKNNVIVWDYTPDILNDVTGDGYRFELTVRKVEQSSFPWLWVGLGTAAVGGVAAILLLRGSDTPQETPVIPVPTGSRPY